MSLPSARAVSALFLATALATAAHAAPAPAADAASAAPKTVRPELFKPLKAAQDLLNSHQPADALVQLKAAEAVGNLTPYETYLVTRLRALAELSTSDLADAERDLEATLASAELPAADRLPFDKALAQIYYRDQKYAQAAKAIQRYLDAGGNDAQLREMLPQAQYASKDFAAAAKGFQAEIDAATAAGQTPTEKTLRLLASAQAQMKDQAGYDATLERLAIDDGQGPHGHDYLQHVVEMALTTEQLPDRLYLDYYRLKTAAFGRVADADRLSYARMAERAGYPAEAQRVLDDGLAANAFTGAAATEAKQLRARVAHAAAQDKTQQAANEASARQDRDGTGLVALGLSLALQGQAAHGVDLIQQGLAKGGLKTPAEGQLQLGIAQVLAGRQADAAKTFDAIGRNGALGALAHAWSVVAQSQAHAAAAH